MIGRDNCRFPWGHPNSLIEPSIPFHGVIYPDGHPWSIDEIKSLLGDEKFAALKEQLFAVEYYDGEFETLRKTSLSPAIDLDLGDELGTGSPDASAGIGKDNFSIRWTGKLTLDESGSYTISADTDGLLGISIDGKQVLSKTDYGEHQLQKKVELAKGQEYRLRVEYVHRNGPARCRIWWHSVN